jgi:two-component system OmpR family response regulator
MRIVIVEDNIGVAKGIAYVLRDAGHAVDLVHDGDAADAFLRDDGADLIILDIDLPGRDGISILRDMRARGDQRPVLMLTAKSEMSDKVIGLDTGADDYLVKPFDMAELSARVRALTRRVQTSQPLHDQIGDLRFDITARQVSGDAGVIDLPRREVAIFEALLAAQGRTLSKQSLLDSVYGTGSSVEEQVIEVYISRLRKRLRPHGVEIRVQRGLGYAMQESRK